MTPEERREYSREWRKTYKLSPEQREKHKLYARDWRRANPDKVAVNREKARIRMKAYCKKYPARVKGNKLRTLYGIGTEEATALLMAQGGVCAICKTTNWGKHSPCIDHCHVKKSVRGVLCNGCNKGLGFFRDSQEILESARRYLARYS